MKRQRKSILSTSHRTSLNTLIVVICGGSIIALSALAVPNKEVSACEAFPPGAPSQDVVDNSAAVFSGKVAKFEKITLEGEAGDKRIAFFEVDRYWKTSNQNDYNQLIVISEIDSGACGYDFEIGKSYLVYAIKWWHDPNSLYTGLGSGTQPIEDAQAHLAFLGEGKVPTKQLSWDEQINRITIEPMLTGQEQQSVSTILSIVGIGAAIAGAVAFFSLRGKANK